MTLEEVEAANYKPDYDAETLGLVTPKTPKIPKTYTFTLDDLSHTTITCQKPLNSDGTVSLCIKNDELIVTFNTDFIENYEKKLLSGS